MNHNKYLSEAAEISHFNIAKSSGWPDFNRFNLKRNQAKKRVEGCILKPVSCNMSLWPKMRRNKETESSEKILKCWGKNAGPSTAGFRSSFSAISEGVLGTPLACWGPHLHRHASGFWKVCFVYKLFLKVFQFYQRSKHHPTLHFTCMYFKSPM